MHISYTLSHTHTRFDHVFVLLLFKSTHSTIFIAHKSLKALKRSEYEEKETIECMRVCMCV